MSTDTYIDFHSPESWELNGKIFTPESWKKDLYKSAHQAWSDLINSGPTPDYHYCPVRIAYVYNLFMDCNDTLWDNYRNKFHGKTVTPELIDEVVFGWKILYKNAHDPVIHNGQNDFCRYDMVSPEELRKIIEEDGNGKVICFRVD